jgi:2-phospho-L-lactate transferase/gluconeogenesis factor (CofD/UPF0052 family)
MVPQLRDAVAGTQARKVLALNLVAQPGETEGFSPQRHLEVFLEHARGVELDFVLADSAAVGAVADCEELRDAAKRLGAELVLAPVAASDGARHDPELLAAAYDRIFRTHGRIAPWR